MLGSGPREFGSERCHGFDATIAYALGLCDEDTWRPVSYHTTQKQLRHLELAVRDGWTSDCGEDRDLAWVTRTLLYATIPRDQRRDHRPEGGDGRLIRGADHAARPGPRPIVSLSPPVHAAPGRVPGSGHTGRIGTTPMCTERPDAAQPLQSTAATGRDPGSSIGASNSDNPPGRVPRAPAGAR